MLVVKLEVDDNAYYWCLVLAGVGGMGMKFVDSSADRLAADIG